MLSGAEPRIAQPESFPIKNEDNKDAMSSASSPKSTPSANNNPIEELANIASSSAPFKLNSLNKKAAVSSIPTSTTTFSQLSATQLFGLLENGFDNKMDITPTQQNDKKSQSINVVEKYNFNFPMLFAGNNGNDNSSFPTPASALLPTATPINQLLQISQQLLNDGIAKQKQIIQENMNNNNNNNSNNNNGKRSSKAADGGEDKTAGGLIKQEISERKRSYPYTFQFCVLCQKNVHSSKLPCHIRQCHVGKPMFQCPVCDFTSTYSKNNVKSHMVSLHGLAGDPISYMDQYAAQVEDFMKKCFPNVRVRSAGRGRPLHGQQLSPSFKQELLMSPTHTVASGCSNNNTKMDNSLATILEMTPTPVKHQHRRHSSTISATSALFTPNMNSHQTTQRGRQKGSGSQRNANKNSNNNGNASLMNSSLSFMPPAPQIGDWYGSMGGMVDILGKIQQREQQQKEQQKMNNNNNFDKIVFPPFNTAPGFNPFNFYFQNLNGLFPNGFHANFIEDMKNSQSDDNSDNCSKVEEINASEGLVQETTTAAGTFLEECLNLSQKILKEMDEKNGQQMEIEGREEEEVKNNNDIHFASSTISPPSLYPFPNCANQQQVMEDSTAGDDDGNEQPKYFPHTFKWPIMEDGAVDLEKTVFSTFSNDANDLIEVFRKAYQSLSRIGIGYCLAGLRPTDQNPVRVLKFDLGLFESLTSEQNSTNGSSLLTLAQREKVANIRSQLKLQSFEIMFALHRFDQNILGPEQVKLVKQIAPTKADIRRFALTAADKKSSLDKEERFILDLSKIVRLNETLAIMAVIGEFDQRAVEINQQLQTLSSAAKLLYNSAHFRTILYLLLISLNLIGGDFTVQLVKGFKSSRILQMCSFRFPDGTILLEVLAKIMQKHFPELSKFIDQSKKTIEEASKVEFLRIIGQFHSLEKAQALIEEELVLARANQQLTNFLEHTTMECANLKETIQGTKDQLLLTLEFFGESFNRQEGEYKFRPERFFSVIAQFISELQNAINNF